MRKVMIGTAMVGMCLAMTACNKPEAPVANETVVEETAPAANESMDMNGMEGMNAADANAADANAVEGNATEQGSTDH